MCTLENRDEFIRVDQSNIIKLLYFVILTTYVSKIGDIEKLIYAKNYKFLFNENFLISMFIMLKLSVNRETKICFKKKTVIRVVL